MKYGMESVISAEINNVYSQLIFIFYKYILMSNKIIIQYYLSHNNIFKNDKYSLV